MNEDSMKALAVVFATFWCIITLILASGMLSAGGVSVALILPLIMFFLGIVFFAFSYKNTIQIKRAISVPKKQKEEEGGVVYETTLSGTTLVDGHLYLEEEEQLTDD